MPERRLKGKVPSLAAALIVGAVLWEGARLTALVPPTQLPSVLAVLRAALFEVTGPRLTGDIAATLGRSLSGLFGAVLLGVPLGLLAGASSLVGDAVLPIANFLRNIPVSALYPVVVLLLGIGDRGKIGMAFFATFLIILVHSASVSRTASPLRRQIARLYGASTWHLLRHVVLHETAPVVWAGVRVATGLALVVTVLAEMFMGAARGIGQSVMEAYSVYELARMYALLLWLGCVGSVIDGFAALVERRLAVWRR